jgi:hypothetical protein
MDSLSILVPLKVRTELNLLADFKDYTSHRWIISVYGRTLRTIHHIDGRIINVYGNLISFVILFYLLCSIYWWTLKTIHHIDGKIICVYGNLIIFVFLFVVYISQFMFRGFA